MSELNRVIGKLVRALKSRDNQVRDQSRQSLLIVLDRIGGAFFFSFVLAAMASCLREGFDKHILLYTLHALLEKLVAKTQRIDHCLDQVARLLLDDTLGKEEQELN